MALWIKQSTSIDVPIGPFLDSTDGNTEKTALSITQPDIRLKKNGGNWGQKNAAQTLTHEEAGWYEVTLDATDTNTLGHLVVSIHKTGALSVFREFLVVPANLYDSVVSGSDRIDVAVAEMAADTLTASALAADAVDEILDDQIGDGTLTVRQALRVLIAGMAGKLSGAATTTVTIRNAADSANVIVATVDSNGNRSAVTITP